MLSISERVKRFLIQYPNMRRVFNSAVYPFRMKLKNRVVIQRELLNNLSSLLADDPIIKVPEMQGEFFIDPRSDLFKRLVSSLHYEPKLVECSLSMVDSERDVLDIGANVGFYSVLLAKNIRADKRVLAIEPTSSALFRLKKNIARNKVENQVIVVAGIVSNTTGKSVINVVPGREEYSTIGAVKHPSVNGVKFVQENTYAFTLDELVSRHNLSPGFIKMDVEGAEGSVLEGAVETIKNHRPVILSELSDSLLRSQGFSAMGVVDKLKSFDYQVIDPMHPTIAPGKRECGDILCVPKEISNLKLS